MFRKLLKIRAINIGKTLAIIVILTVISCKKNIPLKEELNGEKEILVGTWDWVYSDHKFGWCDGDNWFEQLTPQTESMTLTIDIIKSGLLRIYRNDSLFNERRIFFTYFEKCEVCTMHNAFHFIINGNNSEEPFMAGYVNSDTLVSSSCLLFPFEPGCENYATYFLKK